MMKTAKLEAISFKIICPACGEPQERRDRPGVVMFGPEDVTPGKVTSCADAECKQPFRLPGSLKAQVK
jgi:hypothetical protein